MGAINRNSVYISSTAVRFLTYVYLRIAALPFLLYSIWTLFFLVYVPAFIYDYLIEPRYALIDEVDVEIKETVPLDENGNADETIVQEDVTVEETIAIVKRPDQPLRTLLTGLPSPNSMVFTVLTFLVNLACVLMVADLVYQPLFFHKSEDLSFARVGYVTDTEAKLLIREPDQSKMPVSVRVHIKNAQAPNDNPFWQDAGRIMSTSNETDYTAVITIPLARPGQRMYEYKTSNNHSGEFVAAPAIGKTPDLFDGRFTFLATSCILPRLPYNPFDHALAIPGAKHLAKVLPGLGAHFMLFLGDFIYIDVPRRFGTSLENYRMKYRQVYASPDWPAVGQNLSWIHVLDDHEIENDWDRNTSDIYATAVDPWHHYQTAVNPPAARSAFSNGLLPRHGATYFSFTQGPASFFMLDTRTYRSTNSLPFNSSEKTMLGETQLEDFLYWLRKPEPKGVKWKIVASSVPVTKNWRVNTRDTWGGFLFERKKVLEAMWDAGLNGVGVVILSGDRHEFGATAFPPPKDGKWPEAVTVHEFSASPLNQFYSPFATYKQTDDEDVKLKYINTGNSKVGALTIENHANGEQSSLLYRLFVDGVEKWNTVIVSPTLVSGGSGERNLWDRIRGLS